MPLPRTIVAYAAGTDTRAQFTTPPDPRQVADLVTAHEDPVVGGTIRGSFNHTSSGSWVRFDFGSGNKVTDDGNWNGTYDCWVPPSGHFDDYTTIYVDIPWRAAWYGNGAEFQAQAQAATRSSVGSGSVLAEYNGYYCYVGHEGSYSYAHTASGCIPAVPLTTGQTVEFRVFQDTGSNQTIDVAWGVRLHGAA